MASGIRQLYLRLGMDTSGLKKGVGSANTMLSTMTKAAAITGAALVALATKAGMAAVKYEQIRLTFDAFTGSAKKSREVLRDLEKMAIKTPFTSNDLVQGSEQLLGFGLEIEKLMPTLRMLGDLSRGNSEKFQQLAYTFGQARAEGKAMSKDLRQFITAGVPVLKLLSAETGRAENEIFKMAEKGQISFDLIERAFKRATSEGGQFFDFMARQSTTAGGLFSTFADAVQIFTRRVGEYMLPTLKEVASVGIGIMESLMGKMEQATENDAPIRMAASFRAAFETIKVIAQSTSYVIQGMFQVAKEGIGALMEGAGFLTMMVGRVTGNMNMEAAGGVMGTKGSEMFDKAAKKIKELHMLGEILRAQNGSLGDLYDRVWTESYKRITETENALKSFNQELTKTVTTTSGGLGAAEAAEAAAKAAAAKQRAFMASLQGPMGMIKTGEAPSSIDFSSWDKQAKNSPFKGKIADVSPIIKQAADESERLGIILGMNEERLKSAMGFAESFGNLFVSAFDQIIQGGFKFGKFMKQLFMDIIKQAIKAFVITMALKAIGGSGSIGDIFKTAFGGGDLTGFLLKKTAIGGITTRPQRRIVGEAGPEAIIPLNRGSSKNMFGGGGTNKIVGIIRGRDMHLLSVMGQQDAMRRGSPIIQF